jgi:hypothetical protein
MNATHANKTTKAHASKTVHESETPMNATHATKKSKAHTSKSAHVPTTTETESTPMTTSIPATIAATTSTPASTPTPALITAPVTALPYIKAPPPITLPPVPAGVVTAPPAQLRAQLPRKQELEAMPGVEIELDRFSDFDAVFGKTAPSQAEVDQTLTSAFQWSTLRIALSAWERYAQAQEVSAWLSARAIIARLAPAFALAVKTDASIGVNYPSLGQLFGVRASIAKRGVASRAANKKQKDAGLPEYKGGAGKQRKKAAARAALAAQAAAGGEPSAPSVGATLVSTAAPTPVATPAPVATPVATPVAIPVVSVAPPAVSVAAPAVPVAPQSTAAASPVPFTPPAASSVTTVGHS